MSKHITYTALAAVGAKTEIDVPSGIKLAAIVRGIKVNHFLPADSLDLTREVSYDDVDIASGEIALADGTTAKAKGRAFKLGDALTDGDLVIVEGILSGEVQGYGDGT